MLPGKKLRASSREKATGVVNRVFGTFSTKKTGWWETPTPVELRTCGHFQN